MFSETVKTFAIFVIAIIVGVASAADLAADEGSKRIINGDITTIDKAPHMVELRLRNNYFSSHEHQCGGTLVSSRFVVTAAHCFENYGKEDYVVVANISTLSEQGERRSIEDVFIHPEYSSSVGHHKDVAVVKLDREMLATFSKPIKLCDHHLEAEDFIRIFGWGLTKEDDYSHPSENLRTVRVKILAQDDCVKRHADVIGAHISDSMMCAIGDNDEDACTTDSGGPGIYNKTLCAIIVGGVGCGRAEYGGLYVRIDQVRDFIEDAMKN